MSKIAKVRVLAMVDGKRREFAPGERLPELAAADIANLTAMGAIDDAPDQDSSERDVVDPEGKADAAGGGNAGTNTTREGDGSGSGALSSDPATGLAELSAEPGEAQPEIDPAAHAKDAKPIDKPKAAPRARRTKE